MPPVIQGNPTSQNSQSLASIDYSYKYANGLNLKPGSKLHDKLRDELLSRARASALVMSKKFDTWRKLDESLSAYIRLDSEEQAVKESDERKPTSIVFPYSYAILETILSYMTGVFLQDPVFKYSGVGPEDVTGSILMQHVVSNHVQKFKVKLALYHQMRDAFVYGLGISAPVWKTINGTKILKVKKRRFSSLLSMFIDTGELGKQLKTNQVLYEGNALENIDPYLYLPDPNVAIHKVQDGEYVGWLDKTNLMKLKREEASNSGTVFNVKYLNHLQNRKSCVHNFDADGRSVRVGKPSLVGDDSKTNPVHVIRMYIDLVPSDWGLGNVTTPEKWMFALAADEVIISATPTNLAHQMYPVSVIAPDSDGYSASPTSRLDILSGLQTVLDFLFNSHVANVRKSISGSLVVDPYSINVKDIERPGAQKIIKTRRPHWGKGVKDLVQQLQIHDTTQQNIRDSAVVVDWMQQVGASDSGMMGSMRQSGPERLSSAEAQGTIQGAVNRMKRIAMLMGWQGINDIGYLFAAHTQQLMSQEVYVTLSREYQDKLNADTQVQAGRTKVGPLDMLVDFDLIVQDGSVVSSEHSGTWIDLFKTIVGTEQLNGKFDVVRIFKHIARSLGASNVDDFEIRIVPDAAVPGMVAQGQIAPTNMMPAPMGGQGYGGPETGNAAESGVPFLG